MFKKLSSQIRPWLYPLSLRKADRALYKELVKLPVLTSDEILELEYGQGFLRKTFDIAALPSHCISVKNFMQDSETPFYEKVFLNFLALG